jgi:hypothetical protein
MIEYMLIGLFSMALGWMINELIDIVKEDLQEMKSDWSIR